MRADEDALGALVATSDPIKIAAEIVAAFISYNAVPITVLPSLIASVHAAVSGTAGTSQEVAAVSEPPKPAVSIPKSVTQDYLICLEDGKRFKSLRRHLALLGMTPEQYRAKWNLPSTYPMVAANYAAKRSELAKGSGLGRTREKPAAAPVDDAVPRKRGRPRKVKT